MHTGGNLHISHSCASMHKPEHWQQCIIYQMVMSKADGSAGNDCPWLLECNTPVSTFYFLVHLSHVLQASYEHDQCSGWKLGGYASARHMVWKWANPDKLLRCSLWYWWCQNGIWWEMRQSHFMTTATEISWAETVRDVIYKEFCLSSYRRIFSSWCCDLSALKGNLAGMVTCITYDNNIWQLS